MPIKIIKHNGQCALLEIPTTVQPKFAQDYIWSLAALLRQSAGGSREKVAKNFLYYNGSCQAIDDVGGSRNVLCCHSQSNPIGERHLSYPLTRRLRAHPQPGGQTQEAITKQKAKAAQPVRQTIYFELTSSRLLWKWPSPITGAVSARWLESSLITSRTANGWRSRPAGRRRMPEPISIRDVPICG